MCMGLSVSQMRVALNALRYVREHWVVYGKRDIRHVNPVPGSVNRYVSKFVNHIISGRSVTFGVFVQARFG